MSEVPKIRIVGRQKPSNYGKNGLKGAENLLQLVRDLRGGRPLAPCGVYRFKSHEEADQWMMQMLTRPNRARQR